MDSCQHDREETKRGFVHRKGVAKERGGQMPWSISQACPRQLLRRIRLLGNR